MSKAKARAPAYSQVLRRERGLPKDTKWRFARGAEVD